MSSSLGRGIASAIIAGCAAAFLYVTAGRTPSAALIAALSFAAILIAGLAVERLRDLREALRAEAARLRHATDALAASERQLRLVVRNVPVILFQVDRDERVAFAEGKELARLGLEPGQIIGRPLAELYGDRHEVRDALRRAFAGEESTTKLRFAGVSLELQFAPLTEAGGAQGAIGVAYDITETERVQELLEHQALHDPLTGLANRTLLRSRMEGAMRDASGRAALLVLDLDRFKEVNDVYGHGLGDVLLGLVGERMREVLQEKDVVARLGGDEFAVLLPRAERAGAERAAVSLRAAIQRPFLIDGHELCIGASVGIALYPDHGDEPDALLRRADLAMYAAKRGQIGQTVAAA